MSPIIEHYRHDSTTSEWLREMRAMEDEAAREPLWSQPATSETAKE